MEMHQVRYFLAVARVLNFTRAAEECNVTQPSLTRSIQKLEEEFGGLLFRRERSLTHLTDLGREMLPHLQRSFDAAQAARTLARQIGKAQVAPLSLGVADRIRAPALSQVLRDVGAEFAGFELNLRTGTTPDIVAALMRGDLDLALVERPADPPERMDSWELYRQPYVVAVHQEHQLASADSVSLANLHEAAWIAQGEADEPFDRLCAEAAVAPKVTHRVTGDAHVLPLVAAGLGAALLPASTALPAGVVAREIPEADLSRAVVLAAIAGRQRSTPAEALLRAARGRAWNPD